MPALPLVLSLALASTAEVEPVPEGSSPRLPDALGFAGMAAALLPSERDSEAPLLLFAGGSNFPNATANASTAKERGPKVFYDHVGLLGSPCGGQPVWAGRLPYRVGYAASGGLASGFTIAGGCNELGHLRRVSRVSWSEDAGLRVEERPEMPRAVAYAAYAQLGSRLYVFGGLERPEDTFALREGLVLELLTGQWKALAPMAAGRMLAGAAAYDGRLFVVGGCSLHADAQGAPERTYLRDVLIYDPATDGWAQAPELPETLAAMPGPLPVVAGAAYVLGGDNGDYYRASLAGKAPKRHPGQSRKIYSYAFEEERWVLQGETALGVATAPAVSWGTCAPVYFTVVAGETRPGVRTPVLNTVKLLQGGSLSGEEGAA